MLNTICAPPTVAEPGVRFQIETSSDVYKAYRGSRSGDLERLAVGLVDADAAGMPRVSLKHGPLGPGEAYRPCLDAV